MQPAIRVSGVEKSYGRRGRKNMVLKQLEMTVEQGKIYGLLGPSGCGKTTLLQCLVGKLRVDKGTVHVFGKRPGNRASLVPGPNVGYMPQELALYGEFTIAETLKYFGRIYGMTSKKVQERIQFLLRFLDLPTTFRLISNLSGGQQRRASLAVALLQEPKLLILDEPTVGVDPLLRQVIWNHLTKISSTTTTTIVITTHYIEEARQAHMVGMMRNGRLLAEDTPASLLATLRLTSLEDVFLVLCKREGNGEEVDTGTKQDVEAGTEKSTEAGTEKDLEAGTKQDAEVGRSKDISKTRNDQETETRKDLETETRTDQESESGKDQESSNGPLPENTVKSILKVRYQEPEKTTTFEPGFCYSFVQWNRLLALIIKNLTRMWRNLGFLIFQFILPAIQVSLFCLAIGGEPYGMSLAVVNEELVGGAECATFSTGCLIDTLPNWLPDSWAGGGQEQPAKNFSCRYLAGIDESTVSLVYFSDYEEAYRAVERAEHWGILHFKANYTEMMEERFMNTILNRTDAHPDATIANSTIHIHLDMTNQQVGFIIQKHLGEVYQSYAESLLTTCGIDKEAISLPIQFEEPVYGSSESNFTEFMAPGVILSIIFFMAVGLTALGFVMERRMGLLDRSWIAGVSSLEVMLAHVLAQFLVMVVQAALVLIFMILIFEVPARGPIIWVIVLTLLQGLCGMAFGLVISAVCDNEQDAIQVALGTFYPNMLLSGIIWPLEGMPVALRYLSYPLPQTLACEAMRGILSRGWGVEWQPVYAGILVTVAWIIVLLLLSAGILRAKR